jgi:type I restriction-modification system DNA methylase subunit/restriction endonuclease S subunit
MSMSKQYSCDLCKKVFNQKIDFTRHQNKKAPCITLTEMQQIIQTKEVKMDNKTTHISVFKSCLNIMRDNEGLTGEKALRNLAYLLTLKLLEPQFEDKINIDGYNFDFSHIEDEMVEKHKKKLLEIVRFSNLANEKEDNIQVNMKYLWDDILSNHPTTKNVFLKGKGFDIQHKSTYKKLIDKLIAIDLYNTEYDVLGNSYEEVIKDIMTGKVYGQFFTQPLVKKILVKLVDPQIHPDGKIDTCGDPAMGTGGFLITYLQYVLQQATDKGIVPDWNFIKTEGLYGKEIEPDTYQLAVSNMLISSGHMFEGLDRGDSIREPITRKFDNILSNPPYGIKGLNYDDFQSPLKAEYVPIKTDNAVCLFIQSIIYMLKINGKCAVVLPAGQELLSKTNATFVTIREYLMKTCDLKEVIYLPSGIFTYTSIKTCIFYFVKKREGNDVLEITINISKKQKKNGRDYKFSKTYQTTKVKFYDCNPYEDVKNLLVEVPIEKIVSNSYSLNYADYMKDDAEEEEYEEGVVVKTLGEVCKFLPKSKRNAKYGDKEGLYPFFKSSIKISSYVDDPDYEEESLIIGDGGEPNINYGIKFSASDHCYIIQNKNKLLLNLKFAYYYLYHNLDIMNQLYTGIAIKNISKTNIEGIKIPIPSLERQHETVKYLDFIYEKANKTSNEQIAVLKQQNEFCLNNQKIFGENVVKTLGEVCKVNQGTYIKPDMKIQGEYPVYGGGNASYYINQYNREDEIIVAKDGVSADCVRYEKNKFFLNHHGWTLICKEQIIKIYMFYYLQFIQPELLSIAKGTAQLGINQENFYKLKISVPSLERQKEIVEFCEYNDTLIKQLEKDIKNNKKQAYKFITDIVKTQVQTEEQSDTSSVNTEPINEVQDEIVYVEEEVIIEPKPKVKKFVKKVKKPLIIVEEDNEV